MFPIQHSIHICLGFEMQNTILDFNVIYESYLEAWRDGYFQQQRHSIAIIKQKSN